MVPGTLFLGTAIGFTEAKTLILSANKAKRRHLAQSMPEAMVLRQQDLTGGK